MVQKVLTPDKRSAIKDYKSFCMLAFLLIYNIRYQSLQEMNTLSVSLPVCFMFLYACFCMEAMLLIEYEGLMANENYL